MVLVIFNECNSASPGFREHFNGVKNTKVISGGADFKSAYVNGDDKVNIVKAKSRVQLGAPRLGKL